MNRLAKQDGIKYSDMRDTYLDINDLQHYSIIDIYNDDCASLNADESNVECCTNCFFSDGTYCTLKDIYISEHSPLCWFYRDCLTMRASDDFQDDDDMWCES